jgi:hypothetical protein
MYMKGPRTRRLENLQEIVKMDMIIRSEVFTAVTMKNAAFWHVTPCGSCNNRRFGGPYHIYHHGDKNR